MSRKFIKYNDRLCRILKENRDRNLIIDCMATSLSVWINNDAFDDLPETEIIASDVIKGILAITESELNPTQTAVINKRISSIHFTYSNYILQTRKLSQEVAIIIGDVVIL